MVADADAKARTLVSDLLARAGYLAVLSKDGEEALEVGRSERPELAVLDVGLPGISGYEVCRALKDEFGERLQVILVSGTRTEPYDRAAGMLIGADDYVTKPFDPGELLARVRRCIARTASIDKSANGRTDSNSFGLSPREQDVLELLGQGLGTAAIAERLVISTTTVATHIQRILSKLGAHSRAEAIAIAYRAQLIDGVEAHKIVESL
ncbi:MAG: response regulator transcription factor [Gaiellaceae bacterium]